MNFLRDIDEFTGYSNGDGTFRVDIQTWVTDKDGNKKPATLTMTRLAIEDLTVTSNLCGETTWSATVKGY